MAQLQILAHDLSAQVQIAILHADVVAAVGLILDGEGRRLALAQDVEFLNQDLNVACGHLGILRLALADRTDDLNAVFTAQLVSTLAELGVDGLVEHQLRQTIAIAQVGKRHAAHLARALYPSGQLHFLAGIGEPELTTCLCSIHLCTRYIDMFSNSTAKVDIFSETTKYSAI